MRSGNRGDCLRHHSCGSDSLREIESLFGLANAGQLADADVEGLARVLGCPDVVIMLETDEDLVDLHGATIALEHLHNGWGERA